MRRPEDPWNPATEREAIGEALDVPEKGYWGELRHAIETDFRALIDESFTLVDSDIRSQPIFTQLDAKGWTRPITQFLEGEKVCQDWLDSVGVATKNTTYPDALLVFNLPAPVARFWWKVAGSVRPPLTDREREQHARDLRAFIQAELAAHEAAIASSRPIEEFRRVQATRAERAYAGTQQWGHKYREGIPDVRWLADWLGMEDRYLPEDTRIRRLSAVIRRYGGFGHRLNELGQHDPRSYYYVWGWWKENVEKARSTQRVTPRGSRE